MSGEHNCSVRLGKPAAGHERQVLEIQNPRTGRGFTLHFDVYSQYMHPGRWISVIIMNGVWCVLERGWL